jgi:hypothetical protein
MISRKKKLIAMFLALLSASAATYPASIDRGVSASVVQVTVVPFFV